MDYQLSLRMIQLHETSQRRLKPTGNKPYPWISNIRQLTASAESSLSLSRVPILRQSLERIKSVKTTFRVLVQRTPEADAGAFKNSEFEIVDRSSAALQPSIADLGVQILSACQFNHAGKLFRRRLQPGFPVEPIEQP